MAISTSTVQVFQGGTPVQQYVVGYASATNWVARYSFSVGSTGANALQWDLINNYLAGGSLTAGLEWQINTSPSSYANANGSSASYPAAGTVSITDMGGGSYRFFGSAGNFILLPNTTYYLWIFPATTTYGYFNLTEMQTATVAPSGAAGIVRIYYGATAATYQPYIYTGSGWQMVIPYICNGSSWIMY